jgi:hypothetical protein
MTFQFGETVRFCYSGTLARDQEGVLVQEPLAGFMAHPHDFGKRTPAWMNKITNTGF